MFGREPRVAVVIATSEHDPEGVELESGHSLLWLAWHLNRSVALKPPKLTEARRTLNELLTAALRRPVVFCRFKDGDLRRLHSAVGECLSDLERRALAADPTVSVFSELNVRQQRFRLRSRLRFWCRQLERYIGQSAEAELRLIGERKK